MHDFVLVHAFQIVYLSLFQFKKLKEKIMLLDFYYCSRNTRIRNVISEEMKAK